MLKINGVAMPTPKDFTVDFEDIDGESERNAAGELMRDRIATKTKLNIEWPLLTSSEISVILKAVKDVFFDVTYPDPYEGMELTKNMYVGNRTAALYLNGNPTKWDGLKMAFIER